MIGKIIFELSNLGTSLKRKNKTMIKKIISGGQTEANKAALNVSIKYNIPHGDWIPEGRLMEDGPLSEKYQLQEIPANSHSKRIEQNVMDSDGTLIVSIGPLIGDTAYTIEMTQKHNKPCIYINMDETSELDAASIISSWAIRQEIEVLNVAGPHADSDSGVYWYVRNVIEMVYHMGIICNEEIES